MSFRITFENISTGLQQKICHHLDLESFRTPSSPLDKNEQLTVALPEVRLLAPMPAAVAASLPASTNPSRGVIRSR